MKNTDEETQYIAIEVIAECIIALTLNFAICGVVLPLMPASILGAIGSLLFILMSTVTSTIIAAIITKIQRL